MRRAEIEEAREARLAARGVTLPVYQCQTCPERVAGVTAARTHARQGHKSQRAAFEAGQLHSLHLVVPGPTVIVREFYQEET